MAAVKKMIVTDQAGTMHRVPVSSKNFYQEQNARAKKTLYSGFYEMEEGEADKFIEKNNGRDPKFVRPQDAVEQLSQKDIEIAALKAQLEMVQENKVAKSPKGVLS